MSNQTEYSTQYLENLNTDKTVSPPVMRRAMVGKADDGKYYGLKVNADGSLGESLPTTGNNPSIVLTRNGSGYITNIAKTIGETTYNKVITRDANNYITNIGAWT